MPAGGVSTLLAVIPLCSYCVPRCIQVRPDGNILRPEGNCDFLQNHHKCPSEGCLSPDCDNWRPGGIRGNGGGGGNRTRVPNACFHGFYAHSRSSGFRRRDSERQDARRLTFIGRFCRLPRRPEGEGLTRVSLFVFSPRAILQASLTVMRQRF